MVAQKMGGDDDGFGAPVVLLLKRRKGGERVCIGEAGQGSVLVVTR